MPTTKTAEKKKPPAGVTLSITVTEKEYEQIMRSVMVRGYSSAEEWLVDAVLCFM